MGTLIAICWVLIIHTLKWVAIRGNQPELVENQTTEPDNNRLIMIETSPRGRLISERDSLGNQSTQQSTDIPLHSHLSPDADAQYESLPRSERDGPYSKKVRHKKGENIMIGSQVHDSSHKNIDPQDDLFHTSKTQVAARRGKNLAPSHELANAGPDNEQNTWEAGKEDQPLRLQSQIDLTERQILNSGNQQQIGPQPWPTRDGDSPTIFPTWNSSEDFQTNHNDPAESQHVQSAQVLKTFSPTSSKGTISEPQMLYKAPFFTTWFISIWNVLFMPIFAIISSCCFRNEDNSTKKLLV